MRHKTWLFNCCAVIMFAALLGFGEKAWAQDKPVVDRLFGDHMVLQREMPVPVWGTARPGNRITVKFAGQEKSAEADKGGKWMVRLAALKASAAPAEMFITSSADKAIIKLSDVLVGDVYLCSGQSNMELPMSPDKGPANISTDIPGIRQSRFGLGWAVCNAANVKSFSAAAFFFARKINMETGVPIGLVNNSVGGTNIEPWTSPDGLVETPELKGDCEAKIAAFKKMVSAGNAGGTVEAPTFKDPKVAHNPPLYSILHYQHTVPLIPYAIRAVLWYQGEGNGGEGDIYMQKMKALIRGWRKAWGREDLPVYFVQLPYWRGNNEKPEGGDGWAKIRIAQLKSLCISNTAMAVTIDTGDANVHPKNKYDVGERLARLALVKDYGRKDLVLTGPLYKGMKVESGKIRIFFDYAGKGLMVGKKNGMDPVVEDVGAKLKRFAIAEVDPSAQGKMKWAWAEAVIDGDTVVVSSPEIHKPVAVHYAYSQNPAGCNLYNKDGLPASPFRTED